ncbi:sigma-70 family RNA polymerase sigma factor [Arenibacter sp. BSSL-BM3]|uniref:Sigma-70 family RNA polymerase sigma factor n=1 Tax=Arenibacter arenosicollis TaxID=2762274 RepID=A0ABR7QKN6_9FLAO|nr:sigma-70 family RNA polymerase sigma factor [Arenibacter arenosicollis]MBC8767752.1 sigma-70 family RNA polymerase sigma factor [Arenibacter arenosicollis]
MNQTKTNQFLARTQEETFVGVLQNNDLVLRSLYEGVYPKVRHFILQNNGVEDQAKDMFQEAFVATWKNVKDGKLKKDNGLNVEAYLFTIAKNKWLDYLRSSRYKKTTRVDKVIHLRLDVEEEESEPSQDQDEMVAMQRAFKQLGEKCKMVLKLFYYERKSMDEISSELQITSASVRNQKYRCMEKLRLLSLEIKSNG